MRNQPKFDFMVTKWTILPWNGDQMNIYIPACSTEAYSGTVSLDSTQVCSGTAGTVRHNTIRVTKWMLSDEMTMTLPVHTVGLGKCNMGKLFKWQLGLFSPLQSSKDTFVNSRTRMICRSFDFLSQYYKVIKTQIPLLDFDTQIDKINCYWLGQRFYVHQEDAKCNAPSAVWE